VVNREIAPNRFDRDGSNLRQGLRAEELFAKTATLRGWKVREPSSRQDINEHWDLEISKEGERYRVDVKAMKRLSRKDPAPQEEWHWVELHGVRPYDEGWLYGGKAELIAFETKDTFVIVKREELIRLVEEKVDFSEKVSRPYEAKYKLYQRRNRHDRLTLVKTEDLKRVKWDEWEKPKEG